MQAIEGVVGEVPAAVLALATLGLVPLALVPLALVPLARESAEALRERATGTAPVEIHSELAEGLLPWVAALVVVAATGITGQAAFSGHSGAMSVWSDVGSISAPAGGEDDD